MSGQRIFLLAKRYIIARFFKIEDFIDFVFWPLLDIIIWGGAGAAMASRQGDGNAMAATVTSVVFMRIFLYAYFNNATNFLYEMMARNIINLFSTPASFREWLCGAMVSGAFSTAMLVLFATLVAWAIFGINLLSAGFPLFIFIVPLAVCGWALAHVTIAVLIHFGVHAQRLAWVLGWLFIPFSGVYYSLAIMPQWIQVISRIVPMSYLFTALRAYLLEGHLAWSVIGCGYLLSVLYFIVGTLAAKIMFERARRNGLASLERS